MNAFRGGQGNFIYFFFPPTPIPWGEKYKNLSREKNYSCAEYTPLYESESYFFKRLRDGAYCCYVWHVTQMVTVGGIPYYTTIMVINFIWLNS